MSVARGSSSRLLVLFRLGPHRFALAAENVLEICEVPEGSLPAGSFTHRGRELPLVDLRERFQVKAVGEPRAALVTQGPEGSGPLVLLVDGVDAVIPFGADSLMELPDPLRPFLADALQGLCVLPAGGDGEGTGIVAVLGTGGLGLDEGPGANGGPI